MTYDEHVDCDRYLREAEDKIIQLQTENGQLKEKLLLSESQNYCQICGNILDRYVPPSRKDIGE